MLCLEIKVGQSVNQQYLLSAYYMPGIILYTKDRIQN